MQIVGHLRCPFHACIFSAPRLRLVAELKLHSRSTALMRDVSVVSTLHIGCASWRSLNYIAVVRHFNYHKIKT